MTLNEAKVECYRWLEYCDTQKQHSEALLKLASEARRGKLTEGRRQRKLQEIYGRGPAIYDGENLEKAMRIGILKIY